MLVVVDEHGQEVAQHEEGAHVEGLDVLELGQQVQEHAPHADGLVEDKRPALLQPRKERGVRQLVVQHLDEPLGLTHTPAPTRKQYSRTSICWS